MPAFSALMGVLPADFHAAPYARLFPVAGSGARFRRTVSYCAVKYARHCNEAGLPPYQTPKSSDERQLPGMLLASTV